jgi:hypothetical protein
VNNACYLARTYAHEQLQYYVKIGQHYDLWVPKSKSLGYSTSSGSSFNTGVGSSWWISDCSFSSSIFYCTKCYTKDEKYIYVENNNLSLVEKDFATIFNCYSTNDNNTNKIIKINNILENENIFLICFDHVNEDYMNERKIMYDIFGNNLKIDRQNMRFIFQYYGYYKDLNMLIIDNV